MINVRVGQQADNRVSPDHLEELLDVVKHAIERDEAICFVGQTRGRFFCSGFDLQQLIDLPETQVAQVFHGFIQLTRLVFHAPVPVATQADGHAIGVGAMLCLASDHTSLHEKGKWRFPEGALGLGLFHDVVDLIRFRAAPAVAQRVLCGAEALTAIQAQDLGLVQQVHTGEALLPKLDEAVSPHSYKHLKSISRHGFLQEDNVGRQVEDFMSLWCSASTQQRIRHFLAA